MFSSSASRPYIGNLPAILVVFGEVLQNGQALPGAAPMPTYLVRTIDKKDLVGIFVAPDVFALALLVDECTDPADCEYQRMKPGGLMWTSPAVPVPLVFDDEDEDDLAPDPIPWSAATMTESWWDSFFEWSAHGRWRPIEFTLEDLYGIDPEEPEPPPKSPLRPKRLEFCAFASVRPDRSALPKAASRTFGAPQRRPPFPRFRRN
jgi:hypothetical protein